MVVLQIMLIMISYIPNTIQRIYSVLTMDREKSALRLQKEIFYGQATYFMTTFQSSFSFYSYMTMGGALFRQTFKNMLERMCRINY